MKMVNNTKGASRSSVALAPLADNATGDYPAKSGLIIFSLRLVVRSVFSGEQCFLILSVLSALLDPRVSSTGFDRPILFRVLILWLFHIFTVSSSLPVSITILAVVSSHFSCLSSSPVFFTRPVILESYISSLLVGRPILSAFVVLFLILLSCHCKFFFYIDVFFLYPSLLYSLFLRHSFFLKYILICDYNFSIFGFNIAFTRKWFTRKFIIVVTWCCIRKKIES